MALDKRLSKTMRIDLTEAADAPKTRAPGALSSLTQMDWAPRRKAPEYVARSRYQELLQSLYDAALVTRLSGEIIDVNARAVEFLRHERADLFVMTIYEIISGADESLVATLTENLDKERFSLIQAYCLRRDGTYFPAEIAVSRLRLDEVCLCFFIRDISWRIEAEQRLQLEHEALRISANGIAITDHHADLQYLNPALSRMLGCDDVEKLLGQDLRDFFADRSVAENLITQVIDDNQTWMIEAVMVASDRSHVVTQVSATANRAADGSAAGIVFSFADITQLRLTEEREIAVADE